MFAYQDEAMMDAVFGDRPAELLPIPATTAKYDFTFSVMPRRDDVVVMAEYCTYLHREDIMQRFLDGYQLILTQMLDSDALLKDISAITERENCLHNKMYNNAEDTKYNGIRTWVLMIEPNYGHFVIEHTWKCTR